MHNWNIGCGAIPQFTTKGMVLPIIGIFHTYTLGIQGSMTFGDAKKKEYDAGTSTRGMVLFMHRVSSQGRVVHSTLEYPIQGGVYLDW